MRRSSYVATLVTLLALLLAMVPAGVGLAAPPQLTLTSPAGAAFGSGAPNAIVVEATTVGSTIASVEYQTVFDDPPGTLVALEMFAQVGIAPAAPLAGAPVNDTRPVPVGLPAGSVAMMVVFGTVTAVDTGAGEWQIGSPPVLVYESAGTAFQGAPVVGSEVRVVGARTLDPGPIVAQVITQQPGGALPADPPVVEMLFLYNGTIESVQAGVEAPGIKLGTTWTVGGVPFRIDNASFPAVIDPGIGPAPALNPVVTVEYMTAADASVVRNVALEIFDQIPAFIPSPLAPNPVSNTDPSPLLVPAGTWKFFVIAGIVKANDPATGEWQIGEPPIYVYESAFTTFDGARLPVAGDEVRVLGNRTLTPGPIVAERVTFRGEGPLPVTPALATTALLFSGNVEAVAADAWTVGGASFVVNDPDFPALIDAGTDVVGAPVTVEFMYFGPPPPDPDLWAPLQAGAAGQYQAVLSPPATAVDRTGLLFLQAANAAEETTLLQLDATLLAAATVTPTAPSALQVSVVSATHVDVSWSDNSDNEVSFIVETADDATFTTGLTQVVVPAGTTTYSNTAAEPGAAFYYRVVAINGAGQSATAPLLVGTPPSAPTGLAVATGGFGFDQLDLSWNDSIGETSYRIERDAGAGFAVIAVLDPGTTSYSDMMVLPDTTYQYRVAATNAAGSTLSEVESEATEPMPPPTPVAPSGMTGDELKVDFFGQTTTAAMLSDSDGEVVIEIALGTTMKDSAGNPLGALSLAAPAATPAAPPHQAVLVSKEFGPAGATFDPPISITLSYDDSSLPAGVAEEDLVIAVWDGTAWVELETTVVASSNQLVASLSHFSTVGALATLPAPAVTIDAPPASVWAGDVTVSVSVTDLVLVAPGGANVPGEGHLHYYMDVEIPTTQGQPAVTAAGTYKATPGTTAVWEAVAPGAHTFGVQLVNSNHTPLNPPVTATMTTTVLALPTVSITAPAADSILRPGNIEVTVSPANFNLAAPGAANVLGQGHLHYYLDVSIPTTQGQPAVTAAGTYLATPGTTATWEGVPPGIHTLGVQLVNNNHTPLDPPVFATITVTVKKSAVAAYGPIGGIVAAVILAAVVGLLLMRRRAHA